MTEWQEECTTMRAWRGDALPFVVKELPNNVIGLYAYYGYNDGWNFTKPVQWVDWMNRTCLGPTGRAPVEWTVRTIDEIGPTFIALQFADGLYLGARWPNGQLWKAPAREVQYLASKNAAIWEFRGSLFYSLFIYIN